MAKALNALALSVGALILPALIYLDASRSGEVTTVHIAVVMLYAGIAYAVIRAVAPDLLAWRNRHATPSVAPALHQDASTGDTAGRHWLTEADHDALTAMRSRCPVPEGVNLAVVKALRLADGSHDAMRAQLDDLLSTERPAGDPAAGLARTAAHEAGHVITAVAMGLSVMNADITADGPANGQTGTWVHETSYETQWAGVVSAMGGLVAERALTGDADAAGASVDIEDALMKCVALRGGGWTRTSAHDLLNDAIEQAERILDEHREAAARVTQALLDVGSLGALDLHRLTADVRPAEDTPHQQARVVRLLRPAA